MQLSVIELILQADYVVKAVLLILLFFSVMSWAIIFYKYRYLSKANKETDIFLRTYRAGRDLKRLLTAARALNLSPLSNIFKFTSSENIIDKAEIKHSLRRFSALESAKLEKYLSFLATTGSATPFIGLFGTVWGITNSFMGIGAAGSASLAIVAPGLAEALIVTAAGLAAAIPAVIAYNYYLSRARQMIIEMEDFSEELLDFFTKDPVRPNKDRGEV